MIIIGLTGSIGMGKSFVAQTFQSKGIGVFDADNQIHLLMEDGGEAIKLVAEKFPEMVLENGNIDRAKLGKIVFADESKLKILESILHPLVKQKGAEFIEQETAKNSEIIIQDIPLLYETSMDKDCHFVIVVSAPPTVQQQRVMQRDNMTDEKYQAILKFQLLQKEKEERADFVIKTDCSKEEVIQQVEKIISYVTETKK